ncbi:MAG: hypothetical protein JO360_04730 [Acidobacteria bacterium]|nr:hypothetical protein [Acidobacteriota bacterium]
MREVNKLTSYDSAVRQSPRATARATHSLRRTRRVTTSLLLLLLCSFIASAALWPALGQKRAPLGKVTRPAATTRAATPRAPVVTEQPVDGRKLDQAMGIVCAERGRDALGSSPIDVMQSRASLELNHPEAIIGAQRAKRLLPVAKELVIEALRQLAVENKIGDMELSAAARRVRAVTEVTPDPDLRDNAAVIMNDTHTIRFGTIFLVGLPSDEGMMSVLSHELTHIADGRQNSLQTLFNLIGKRATRLTGLRVNGQKPEELTCDLVGERAARLFIARTPTTEPRAQRLARTLEHNCVDDDETDEEHLSPRSTMRAVLALDPVLARELLATDIR